MKFSSSTLTRGDKLELLQRWIIVQSILYYEMDFNLVLDQTFDDNCNQLVTLMNTSAKTLPKTQYYYCMKDFDGSTGFDLYGKLNSKDREYLEQIAGHLKLRYGNASSRKESEYMKQISLVFQEDFKKKLVNRKSDSCLWCRHGTLEGTCLRCGNKKSPKYSKLSKKPTKTTCEEWRYKF